MNKSKKRNLYLISNMYPSPSNIRFGIFVKRFEERVETEFNVNKIVLVKHYNPLAKLFGYIKIYIKIVLLFFKVSNRDIIYIHFPIFFSFLLWPFVITKKKVVLNFHGSDIIFDSLLKKVLSLFLYPIIKQTTIVVPSDYYRRQIKKVFFLPEEFNIIVYPSGGVDKTIFYPIESVPKVFTLGFVSNFIEGKGWKVFLEAIQIIKNSREIGEFKVIMVGDGPDLINIQNLISKLELDVTIIRSVGQKKLVKIYSSFNVFVFPTYRYSESLGLVGLEAMMCGIPVIASKVGGPMGYVEDGLNGYLFDRKDKVDLSKKIIRFYNLQDQEKLKMKIKCLETAMKYESRKVIYGLIQTLNEI